MHFRFPRLRTRPGSRRAYAQTLRKLDIYLVLAGEPDAAGFWFELRERAERLSAAVIGAIGEHIRTIAAIDVAWFDTPSRTRRPLPRFVKRWAHRA